MLHLQSIMDSKQNQHIPSKCSYKYQQDGKPWYLQRNSKIKSENRMNGTMQIQYTWMVINKIHDLLQKHGNFATGFQDSHTKCIKLCRNWIKPVLLICRYHKPFNISWEPRAPPSSFFPSCQWKNKTHWKGF